MGAVDFGSDSIPPTGVDESGLLVTSWVLSITWGIMSIQFFTYIQNRRRDPSLLQSLVIFLFLNETVAMVLAYVSLHHQVIVVIPGSFESLSLPKTEIIMSFFNHATLCLVNLFVIWRYHRFTQRWWLTVPLSLATLASCGLYWYTNTLGLQIVTEILGAVDLVEVFATLRKIMLFTKASATMEFVVVTTTYILLLIELSSYLREELLGGKRVIKRLIFMTLESGTVTVALAAGNFANGLRTPDATALNIVIGCAARAYYMTMLFNLNWRNNGGLVMGEPTLSHITSQLRTQSGEPLGDVGSFGTKQNETAIHLGSRTVDEIDEVFKHGKPAPASGEGRVENIV